MTRRHNDNAFPGGFQESGEDGLTVREYYAAAALTGSLACLGERLGRQQAALIAFGYADAMIAESGKGAS